MAVVTAGFIPRNRGLNAAKAGAKDNVKYIQFRPGKDQEGITRTLFGSDGRMERREAYQFIDEAPKGTVFFTIIISPDPKTEDHHRDLDMRAIADTTMQTLEERVKKPVQWVAAVHQEHTDIRHIHALAAVQGRLNKPDLRQLIDSATEACREQRRDLDRELEKHAGEREQGEWDREPELEEDSWER
jgi:hypothetical protein